MELAGSSETDNFYNVSRIYIIIIYFSKFVCLLMIHA